MISSLLTHLHATKKWAIDDSPQYWEGIVDNPGLFATWHEVEMCINNPQFFDMQLVDKVTNRYIELPQYQRAWSPNRFPDAKDIKQAFDAGNTLIINNFDWISRAKQDLLRQVEEYFPNILSALHVYCGLSESKSFKIHEDFANNFIVQVEGITHWQVFAQRASYLVDRFNYDVNADDLDCVIDVDLKPGDILYIPNRCWHYAQPKERRLSVSIPMQHGMPHLKKVDRNYYGIN
jgi:ribosomal protein L16 Arg81 hydroxylase